MEPPSPAQEPVVHFCDLCQESVPEADLASGRALELRGRLVCPSCRRRLVPPPRGALLAAVLAFLALLGALGAGWLAEGTRQEIVQVSGLVTALGGVLEDRLEGLARSGEAWHAALLRVLEEVRTGQEAGLGRVEARLDLQAQAQERALARLARDLEGHKQPQQVLAERLGALETASRLQLEALEALTGLVATLKAAPPPARPPEDPQPALEPDPPQMSPELVRLQAELASPDADARWRALEALEAHGGLEAARLVAGVLEDPDLWVRRLAAEVLGKLGGQAALEGLIRVLADGEVIVRAAAIASLRKLTGEDQGFDPQASAADRRRAIGRWQAWWESRSEK